MVEPPWTKPIPKRPGRRSRLGRGRGSRDLRGGCLSVGVLHERIPSCHPKRGRSSGAEAALRSPRVRRPPLPPRPAAHHISVYCCVDASSRPARKVDLLDDQRALIHRPTDDARDKVSRFVRVWTLHLHVWHAPPGSCDVSLHHLSETVWLVLDVLRQGTDRRPRLERRAHCHEK